jgi:RNA polymerase sigma-70 factor (ECF subfamily)
MRAITSSAAATGPSPSARAPALAGLLTIKTTMRALPEQFRIAMYYADVAGFTCKEIAEIMDTPVGTVTSRLNRGRRRLRKLLADTARERGYDLELRKRSLPRQWTWHH